MPHGTHLGPKWAAKWVPHGQPSGTHYILSGGPTWANVGLPMCHISGSQLGPTYYFPTRTHFTPKWVPCLNLKVGLPTLVPCGEPKWDPLHFVQPATWDALGRSHLGILMLVPIGTHLYFRMGHTWAFPLGHSHVGPHWDPSLFSYGTHLGIPTWAFPCWSQL